MNTHSLIAGIAIFTMAFLAAGCGDNAQTSTSTEPDTHTAVTPRSPDREPVKNSTGSAPTINSTHDGAVDRALADNANKQTSGGKSDYNGIAKPIIGTTQVDRPSPVDTRPETTLTIPDAVGRDGDSTAPSKPRAVDNSGQNEADKLGTSVTPMDQGASENDIAVTRTIRKALTGDSTLSTNAQNIKIITRDGVVVLRGPVASQAEVEAVLSHARTAAGATRIDNQLAVPAP